MRYLVCGTIEMNWDCYVTADSEEEAEKKAIEYAAEGAVEFDSAVDEAEVTLIKEAPQKAAENE